MKFLVHFYAGKKQWYYKKPLSTTESEFTGSRREAMHFHSRETADRLARMLRMKHLQLRGRKVSVLSYGGKGVRGPVLANPKSLKYPYMTGDGKKFATLDEAKEHAEKIFRRKGNIISIVKRNPSRRSAVAEAAQRFEDFTGHAAGKELRARVPAIKVGLAVGKLAGVLYVAKRDGKTDRFFHRFKSSSQPLLIANHDGSALGIVGGRYRFTDRGIVDT